MKQFNTKDMSIIDVYHLLISSVAPRPIAFVGSMDINKNHNLAPFSFFNAFGANPPIIGFSPTLSGRTGLPKDTLLNIKETKEFTVSIVTKDIIEQVSLSSCEYDKGIDEFKKTGLKKYNSTLINSPGVSESPIIMECKLHKIIELGGKPASGNLILGQICMFHINDNLLTNENKLKTIDINHVGRSGGNYYIDTKKSLFELIKPRGIGIGFDKLPLELLNSKLTGNQLAKMASSFKVPKLEKITSCINVDINVVVDEISDLINKNQIDEAWQIILNWKYNNV